MKNTLLAALAWLALSAVNPQLSTALAQGTAFTYQGRLNTAGSPANGNYDFIFTLWSTNSGGSEVGGALTNAGVPVANGLFTVTLDFGSGIYTGQSCWLQVNVETNGVGHYVALTPRQPITPTPYAVYAESSGGVTNASISAVQLNTGGAPSSGQVLSFNGSGLEWTSPAAGGSGWSLNGNAGTSPGSDFLGTTDNEPLQFRVNNVAGLVLYPNPNNVPSLVVGPFAGVEIGAYGDYVFGGGAGAYNTVYPNFSTIAGGYGNTINPGAPQSVIGGGYGNLLAGAGAYGVVGGGYLNTVTGAEGTVPGGTGNLVSGSYGFAAGNSAQATNAGAFVWADASGGAFASTGDNQFSVRALGGVRFVTGGAGMTIDGVPVTGSSGGGSGWSLTGNAGASPDNGDFLGTTDANAFELHVNNARALRLEPGGNGVPNVIGGYYLNAVGSGFGGSFIGGGYVNLVNGPFSAIAGGENNTANNSYDAIGGGAQNTASGTGDTISGGDNNNANAYYSTVSGGINNTASGIDSVVPGGANNVAAGNFSFAAGAQAIANNTGAFVWADDSGGSFASTVNNQFSVRANGGVRFVTGGAGVTIDGVPVGAGGGGGGSGWNLTGNAGVSPANGDFLGTTDTNAFELHVNNTRALRLEPGSGGYPNVIGGDYLNAVGSDFGGAFIGGGYNNSVNGYWSAIAGGIDNTANNYGDAVGGGAQNTASGFEDTISGGAYNTANGNFSTVNGGYQNAASGNYSAVAGGSANLAGGDYSFAAGNSALANHTGAFVWADDSGGSFASTANNQFSVRADGGVRLVTGGAGLTGLTLDGYQVLTTASGGGGGGAGSGWNLTGNAGTSAGVNFLGTTDGAELVFKANNHEGLRLTTSQDLVLQRPSEFSDFSERNGLGIYGFTSAVDSGSRIFANQNVLGPVLYGEAGGGLGVLSATSQQTLALFWSTFGVSVNLPTTFFANTTIDGVATVNGNATITGNESFGAQTRQMIDLYQNGIYDYGIGVQNSTFYQRTGTGGGFAWYSGGVHNGGQNNNGGGTTLMTLDGAGNLGINTATPQAALEVNGPIMLVDGEGGEQAYIGGTAAGDVYIGSLNPSITAISFENLGSLKPMHINCSSITITGGSDLAEPFQISDADQPAPQGAVLVIDEANPGHLKVSDRSYDTRVAGVVSGANGINPGIQMQQKGLLEGGKNVALSGRVYVQADASNGPIQPGDMLTSSATPGRAMKVSDHARAQGAILGKAMTGLKEGNGMVLVLVTLQ